MGLAMIENRERFGEPECSFIHFRAACYISRDCISMLREKELCRAS